MREEGKRVFVSGANGFIGSSLVENLLEDGNIVHALVRNKAKSILRKNNSNLILFEGDITNRESLKQSIKGCHDIFHLAGFVDMWHPKKENIYKINVGGTKNIIEVGEECGSSRMVFVSTAGVWGPSGNNIVTEDTIPLMEPQTDYEKSKREAELEIKRGKNNGLKVVIVNPTRVFGPGLLNKSNVATYFEKYIQGKFHFMPGNGKQLANYVYISDLIKGIKLAIEHGEHQENYLLGGENVTFDNIFTSVGKIAGREYKLFGIPPLLIWLISHLELLKANTIGIKPLITPGFAKKYSNNWVISSEKAKKELGYTFMPLTDSLLEMVNWLRSNN